MKTKFTILLATLSLFALILSGCYTQLKTSRDYDDYDRGEYTSSEQEYEQDRDSETTPEEDDADDQTYSSDYQDNDYNWHGGIGFSYYYPSSYWPSTAFSVAYNNPWSYDRYWYSGYYGGYYNNYYGGYYGGWCGTPYMYYPYYSYGWYPNYFNRYPADKYTWGKRDFGTDRGKTTRDDFDGGRSGNYSPSNVSTPSPGNSINTTGGSRRESYKPTDRNIRSEGNRRNATVNRGRSTDKTREGRGTDSRVGTSRGRDRGNSSVPKYTPTHRGNNDGGSRRGNNDHGNNTPSYTPPPASSTTPSAPRSSPPPSGNQNTGGNRGGNTRGGGGRP